MLPRLLHIALAALVAYASVGVSFRAHYCMERLVDWSVFGQAKTCGMSPETPPELSDEPAVSKTPCCEDVHVFSQLDIEDAQSAPAELAPVGFALSVPKPRTAERATPIVAIERLLIAPRPPPPLLAQRRRARLQSYLI